MSYYDNNGQWPTPTQNNWDHQATTPVRTAGANGPQPQDEFAFSYQFDEVDRAFENLSKSGKTYSMSSRREFTGSPASGVSKHHGRMNNVSGSTPRPHSMNAFDEIRTHGALPNFYSQRHTSSRGSNEAEQAMHAMQTKRRLAAQRERELRNHHTEQQYQRTVLTEANYPKAMSEEETRQLIARQRSALYGEGPFSEKTTYVDETGNIRAGIPAASGPSSLRGASPMTFDLGRGKPPTEGATATPVSAVEASQQVSPVGAIGDSGSRANSTESPQQNTGAASRGTFDGPAAQVSRTSTSSPIDLAKQDLAPGSKSVQNPAVAPIGTRPSGTPVNAATAAASSKRSTTPLASPGTWGGRSNAVWGQPPGLSNQAVSGARGPDSWRV